ncbi:mandelate racemase/muconate lactonizing enzyme family protein [Elioraea rosea]|uniref:mandelate racemase/muconate lactonizing enzyme family protein n=1 Tax=Elioraea rosea TaxID=2492390 RepID=UPI001185BE7D|nr:mandelate racemase/muconate lactonizing enzyme family protein [Elioraea rosea]
MRITAVETVRLPPYDNILWLRLHTDEGLIGLGETFRGAAGVEAHIHAEIAPKLIGADPSRIDAIAWDLARPYIGFRSSGTEMRAASAVDIALWDIAGQATGRPIVDLLGGATRSSIATYNTCAGYFYNARGGRRAVAGSETATGPYDDQIAFSRDAGALALSLLEMGIGAMKIWPFDPFAGATNGQMITPAEIDRALVPFRQIREASGTAMQVMVELHSMWDVTAALTIARAMREFDPFWMEDPIKMTDPAALADYRRMSGLPICASEILATRAQFLDILRADAVDYVMLDLGWCGGISEAKKIGTLAEAHQRPVAPHDCTGPVVFAASTHLALNLPNAVFMESVRAYWSGWYRDLVTALPVVENGRVTVPPGPGLGLALQPDVLARGTVRTTTEKDL